MYIGDIRAEKELIPLFNLDEGGVGNVAVLAEARRGSVVVGPVVLDVRTGLQLMIVVLGRHKSILHGARWGSAVGVLESGLGLQPVVLVRCHGGMAESLLDMAAESLPRCPCFVEPGLVLLAGLVDLLQRRKAGAASAAESALRQGTAHLFSR